MWWHGRGNSGGSWLPEDKKANMWPGRGNSGGSWPTAFPRSARPGRINQSGKLGGRLLPRKNQERKKKEQTPSSP